MVTVHQIEVLKKRYDKCSKYGNVKEAIFWRGVILDKARELGINPAVFFGGERCDDVDADGVLDLPQRTVKKYLGGRVQYWDVGESDDVVEIEVYRDGNQVIGTIPGDNSGHATEKYEVTGWDCVFSELLAEVKTDKNIHRKDICSHIVRKMRDYGYCDELEKQDLLSFVMRKLYNDTAAKCNRIRRFRRKKDNCVWSYYVTFTYSDALFSSPEEFRKKLVKKFNNLAVNHGWRVMGGFEPGEANGRIHFHGFLYIPEGETVGRLEHKSGYSVKERRMHEFDENTDFAEKFGRNEFVDLTGIAPIELEHMMNYIMKYIIKAGCKLFYSRHIPISYRIKIARKAIAFGFAMLIKKHAIRRYAIMPNAVTFDENGLTAASPGLM